MQYDPQTWIDTVFKQVKDILKYEELARYLYTQIQITNIAYTIINRTKKFQDTVKTWNQMNPIQQNWINFKAHFRISHRNIEETGKLTMEAVGYHQSNLVNDIVTHMSGLSFPYPPQDPEYTPTPNTYTTIVPTVQPNPVSNVATDVSNILPQILNSMKQMQQLLIQMHTDKTGGGRQTSNRNTCTCQAEIETIQRQTHKPLPDFANKYFWTHGKCAHEGSACNNKLPKHQYTAIFSNKRSVSTYGCT